MTMMGSVPSDGRWDECVLFFLFRVMQSLMLKGYIAVPDREQCDPQSDDGEGASAVLVVIRVGNLGNFGNPAISGFEDMPGELAFEFLPGLFDFRLDLIQFVDVKRRGKLNLKHMFLPKHP